MKKLIIALTIALFAVSSSADVSTLIDAANAVNEGGEATEKQIKDYIHLSGFIHGVDQTLYVTRECYMGIPNEATNRQITQLFVNVANANPSRWQDQVIEAQLILEALTDAYPEKENCNEPEIVVPDGVIH